MASIPQNDYVEIQYGDRPVDPLASAIRVMERRLDQHIGQGGSQHAAATEQMAGFMSAVDKQKMEGIQAGATRNSPDEFLLNRGNHTGLQAIETVEGLRQQLDDALAGGSNFRGLFPSLAALQQEIPVAAPGNYADVDEGQDINAVRYIWDESDQEWVSAGEGEPLTAPQVKALLLANPNTNVLTDQQLEDFENSADGIERVLANESVDNGAGAVPYSEGLEYLDGTVGDALKKNSKFREDLYSKSQSAPGSVLVGWSRSRLTKEISDVRDALSGRSINIWEFASSADGYSLSGDPSTWDWRPASQAALDYMQSGDELFYPGGYVYRHVNATGEGSSLVQQRANAIQAGTLRAVTSALSGISVVIDGRITSTSALDDVFRMTGSRVIFSGRGSIEGPGIFLDTNPSGQENPDLVQWYPSLLRLDGIDSGVTGLRFLDQVTIGAYLRGSRGFSYMATYEGGPAAHGSGTFQFGIYAGTPIGGTFGHRILNNTMKKSDAGGCAYSGIFSVSAESTISFNQFYGQYEHGIYNYGRGAKICCNTVEGTIVAAGIQNFAAECDIDFNTIRNCRGGIALQNPNRCKVRGNKAFEGISLSAISVRSFMGTDVSTFMNDLEISGNQVALSADKQSVIDVLLDHSFVRLAINKNTISGAPGPGASGRLAAITVRVFDTAGNAGNDLEINENEIFGCDGYAITIGRVQRYEVARNNIVDVNGNGSTSVAMVAYSSGNGTYERNIVIDTRATKRTAQIVQALTQDLNGNTQADRNNGIGLSELDVPLCQLPDGIMGSGNTQESLPARGIFTSANAASMVVNSSVAKAAAAIRPGATIILNPVGKLAVDQQAGANRAYISAVARGSFTIATSSGAAPGQNSIFEFEIIQ